MFDCRFLIIFLIVINSSWVFAQNSSLQDAFWSAMAKGQYQEAKSDVNILLNKYPHEQQYKFQNAELLWASEGPLSAIQWLSQEENLLDKMEIVNFLNKMSLKLTDSNWKDFDFYLLKKSVDPSLSFTESKFFIQGLLLKGTREQFLLVKNKLIDKFDEYPESLQFDLALLMDKFQFNEEVDRLYQSLFNRNPSNPSVKQRIARIYIRNKQYSQANEIIEEGLKQNPDSYELLMLKAEFLESNRDYLQAIAIYDHILDLHPLNQAAFDLKQRAFMNMGANSLALDHLSKNLQADPVLRQRARGNLAMSYIRWNEPQQAIKAMDLKKDKETEDYTIAKDNKVVVDERMAKIEEGRSRWDSILVLRQKDSFDEIIAAYHQALKDHIEVPFWILQVVGDAYLAKRQPEEALSIYKAVLKDQPDSFNVKMSIYYTLVELGRFNEANDLLESIDSFEPIQIKERGILKDNTRKEEIASNKIWLLMYQDRLKKAQKIGEQFLNAAPADTQIRSAMAHLYLWRGWPRKALEEFRIIRTMDPAFISATVGYARALYDNLHQTEARALIKSLAEQYPKNLQIAKAKRQMDVDDMATFTFSGYYTHELSGSDEFYLSTRWDQPITDHHQLFAELIRRDTAAIHGDDNDLTQRFYVGDIYRPNMMWKLTNALTGDYDTGERLGGISEVEFTPDDYWTHRFHYDSRTIDVPLRSRTSGIDVQDFDLSSLYRHSESFNTGVSEDFKDFEDGNYNWNYSWTTDSALWTYAYWKWRLGTEFDYSTYSKQDVNYYSPPNVSDFYFIPNVEHTWYKRYERVFLDRFFLGLGHQWEKNFEDAEVGYIRYEMEYRHSDTLSFLVGTIYSLKSYSGQDMNVLNTYWTIRKRF